MKFLQPLFKNSSDTIQTQHSDANTGKNFHKLFTKFSFTLQYGIW